MRAPRRAALMKCRANQNLVEYMIAFEVPLSDLKPMAVPKSDKSRVQASLMALVRDSSGEVVDKISREVWREVPAHGSTQPGTDHILYTQPLILPRGTYTVDAVVMDEQSGRASACRRGPGPTR
jgi:hypothetical protein